MTFSPSDEFNFSSGSNPGWQYGGEVTRYDHYTMPLESKDLNNIYSSTKMGYDDKFKLATASNATYQEMAFSSAEDLNLTSNFFGGEVAKTSGSVITGIQGTDTHTGLAAVQLTTGNKSFVYKPSTLVQNRTYRASVWTNSVNGAIYYNLNNAGDQVTTPISTMKAGNWYQINVEIPVTTFSSLEVGVKSASGTVNFDDFRFQPRDATLTGNVYDPVTGSLTFVLDNQNMFTQYEYNDQGLLIKTYNESFKYGKKLVSESKINYRRTNIDQ
jgi:hypothetical protein